MSTHLMYRDGTTEEIAIRQYPDGTPVLNLENLAMLRGCAGIIHRYGTYAEFMGLLTFIKSFSLNYTRVKLFLPYLPGARQDRPSAMIGFSTGKTGDVLHSLRWNLDMIQGSGVDGLHVLDVHSDAAYKYLYPKGTSERRNLGFSSVDAIDSQPVLDAMDYFSRYDGIIAPDAGATDRALRASKLSGLPLLLGTKRRDPVNNSLSKYEIKGLVPENRYLVVDDICDSGGTFILLGEALHKAEVNADLFVTHGLFTKGAAERLSPFYGRLITTDSLDDATFSSPLVTRIDMIDKIANERFNSAS